MSISTTDSLRNNIAVILVFMGMKRDGRRPQLDLSNLQEKFPDIFDKGPNSKNESRGPALSVTQASMRAGIGKKVILKLAEDGYLEVWKEGNATMLFYRDLLRATWEASDRGKGPLPGKPGRPSS
jgi:hypothetical protein